jgi:hypothetical protein
VQSSPGDRPRRAQRASFRSSESGPPARALDTGTSYVNDTTLLTTRAGAGGESGKSRRLPEPSAICIGNYARAINPPLRRYLASVQYSFGLIVCRIGDFGAWCLD